jgi:hypothetical protein
MTTVDLTRWNRAGLDQLIYVDGNAVTYLESLRSALAGAFPEWSAVQVAADQPAQVTQERLLSQYQGPVGDYGWELARTFARCCHVLSGYLDAYANEGYLSTASDWDDVRKLVAMLDYVPSPPASASTVIAIDAPAGSAGQVLARGYQTTYTPPQAPAVIFESLADLQLDPELNTLALAPGTGATLDGATTITLPGPIRQILVGDPVVLSEDDELAVHRITALAQTADATTLTITPAISQAFDAGCSVLVQPRQRLCLRGPVSDQATPLGQAGATSYDIQLAFDVTQLAQPPQVTGSIVVSDQSGHYYYGTVTQTAGRTVTVGTDALGNLEIGPIRLDQATAGPAVPVSLSGGSYSSNTSVLTVANADWSYLSGCTVLTDSGLVNVSGAVYTPANPTPGSPTPASTGLTLASAGPPLPTAVPNWLLAPPPYPGPWKLDAPLQAHGSAGGMPSAIEVSGTVNAGFGDFIVLGSGTAFTVAVITSVTPGGSYSTVQLDAPPPDPGQPLYCAQTTVYSGFATDVSPVLPSNSDSLGSGSISLQQIPASLLPGRLVVVERTDNAELSMATTVTAIDSAGVKIALANLPTGTTTANVILHANAVAVGHGQSQPQRVLGSGDATQAGQRFVLPIAGVSFTPDPTVPSGLTAAVVVQVGQQIWQQVADLSSAGPTDPSYTAGVTESGALKFQFGDGIHGRRLPTGANNVRVTYRVGIGTAGNLPTLSLQPARPNPLVADATQLMPATGGAAMEPVGSLRDNAPATLLAFDRAVSLDDYTALALRQPTVQDAVAIAESSAGRSQMVTVVVIPAGGAQFDLIAPPLAAYLTDQAPPDVSVSVQQYELRSLVIDASIGVDTSLYVYGLVAEQAQQALINAFSLGARGLGQAIYESDVVAVLQAIPGVQHSSCSLGIGAILLSGSAPRPSVGAPGTAFQVPGGGHGGGHGPVVVFEEYFLADQNQVIALGSPQAVSVSEASS